MSDPQPDLPDPSSPSPPVDVPPDVPAPDPVPADDPRPDVGRPQAIDAGGLASNEAR